MLCQVCHRSGGPVVCDECAVGLRRPPIRLLDGEIVVQGGFQHEGPAKTLIHHLKYRGVTGYQNLVAAVLANEVPALPVVPVPRALSRRVRYGVDPAQLLARALAQRLGVPVARVLGSPIHTRRRAGGDHARPVGRFRLLAPVESRVLVIDDVVTTGSTLISAIDSIGRDNVALALAANVVSGASTLDTPNQRGHGFSSYR